MRCGILFLVFFVIACDIPTGRLGTPPPGPKSGEKLPVATYEHDYTGPVFTEYGDDCAPRTGEPEPHARKSRGRYRDSGDRRWIAHAVAGTHSSEILLYDKRDRIRYKIVHPQKFTGLADFTFSRHSNYLSLIGTAAELFGICEIYTIDLRDMSHTVYGKAGYCYRHPIYVEEDGSLLFIAGLPGLRQYSMAWQSRVGRIATMAGRYHPDHGETYMTSIDRENPRFIPNPDVWTVNETIYEFERVTGRMVVPDETEGRYLYMKFLPPRDEFPTGTDKYQHFWAVPVDLTDPIPSVKEPFAILRDEVFGRFGGPYEDPFPDGDFREEIVCLDKARIR